MSPATLRPNLGLGRVKLFEGTLAEYHLVVAAVAGEVVASGHLRRAQLTNKLFSTFRPCRLWKLLHPNRVTGAAAGHNRTFGGKGRNIETGGRGL